MKKLALLLLCSGCAIPVVEPPPVVFVPITIPPIAPVSGFIIHGDNGFGCNFVCEVFPADVFCDSDCDGWFDHVEIRFGHNPCNPLSPPYAPNSPATVCQRAFGFPKNRSEASDPIAAYESQLEQLERQ